MKNLMDDINPINLSLKRKIKKVKERVLELEEELKGLQEKYAEKLVEYRKPIKKDKKTKLK